MRFTNNRLTNLEIGTNLQSTWVVGMDGVDEVDGVFGLVKVVRLVGVDGVDTVVGVVGVFGVDVVVGMVGVFGVDGAVGVVRVVGVDGGGLGGLGVLWVLCVWWFGKGSHFLCRTFLSKISLRVIAIKSLRSFKSLGSSKLGWLVRCGQGGVRLMWFGKRGLAL